MPGDIHAVNQVPENVMICESPSLCSSDPDASVPHDDPLLEPDRPGPYPGGFEGWDPEPNVGYVQRVLANEWQQFWGQPALRSGAIAVRSFGMFWVGVGYQMKDPNTGQVYPAVPSTVKGFGANNAPVQAVHDAVLRHPRGLHVL